MKKQPHQYVYKRQFTHPEVRVKKDDNESIKVFLKRKGYNSINDFINMLVYADMAHDFLPTKAELLEKYPTENGSRE